MFLSLLVAGKNGKQPQNQISFTTTRQKRRNHTTDVLWTSMLDCSKAFWDTSVQWLLYMLGRTTSVLIITTFNLYDGKQAFLPVSLRLHVVCVLIASSYSQNHDAGILVSGLISTISIKPRQILGSKSWRVMNDTDHGSKEVHGLYLSCFQREQLWNLVDLNLSMEVVQLDNLTWESIICHRHHCHTACEGNTVPSKDIDKLALRALRNTPVQNYVRPFLRCGCGAIQFAAGAYSLTRPFFVEILDILGSIRNHSTRPSRPCQFPYICCFQFFYHIP